MSTDNITDKELKKLVQDAEKFGWTADFESGILKMDSNSTNPDYKINAVSIIRAGDEWEIHFDGPREKMTLPVGELKYYNFL